jgi:hypothetical protein
MSKNFLTLLSITLVLTTGCHSAKIETPTTSAAPAAAANEPAYKGGPGPTDAELREAIIRNYEDAAVIDNSRAAPFLVGDFNGDNSEDIAIVVKPGEGKLSKLNSEYANWILEDPRQPVHIRDLKSRPAPVTISGKDSLLAVIHGVKSEGWRSAIAKQTYLLKNAVGESFETQSSRQSNGAKSRFRGDVIREKLDGTDGIIYFTGAKYAWHPIV